MRGRIPIHQGTGPGLTPRQLGAEAGQEDEGIALSQLPSHGHGPLQATNSSASSSSPIGNVPAIAQGDDYTSDFTANPMDPEHVKDVGGGEEHDNVMPFLCVHFIIALFGTFPSRS